MKKCDRCEGAMILICGRCGGSGNGGDCHHCGGGGEIDCDECSGTGHDPVEFDLPMSGDNFTFVTGVEARHVLTRFGIVDEDQQRRV